VDGQPRGRGRRSHRSRRHYGAPLQGPSLRTRDGAGASWLTMAAVRFRRARTAAGLAVTLVVGVAAMGGSSIESSAAAAHARGPASDRARGPFAHVPVRPAAALP